MLASPFVQIVETVGTANREEGSRCAKRACACVCNVTGGRESSSHNRHLLIRHVHFKVEALVQGDPSER